MQVKKKQLEMDMEQQTSSKLGKEYVKAEYCHPAYLTYMKNTSYEMPGWMKHKLESRLLQSLGSQRVIHDWATEQQQARVWATVNYINFRRKMLEIG